jgi:hypothetical protein
MLHCRPSRIGAMPVTKPSRFDVPSFGRSRRVSGSFRGASLQGLSLTLAVHFSRKRRTGQICDLTNFSILCAGNRVIADLSRTLPGAGDSDSRS